MKILVAGGAGFIGSHLVERLLNDGHEVICADKLIFGDTNIQHLKSYPNDVLSNIFRVYETELAVQKNVDTIFAQNEIEAVYHLAANSDIQKGGIDPSIDFNDTLMTTKSLLEGMRKSGVKKLFFASTSAVYGERMDIELTELIGDLKPVSYYGGAKLASEALISSYVSMCDIKAVIFRFPNVIGPRLTHGVIYDFIHKLQLNPRELQILGDGSQCKPYIYVYDLIEAISMLTDEFCNGEEIYNLSVRGEGTTVKRIAEIVVNELGLSKVDFKYSGGDRGWKGDVPRFKYNISKILSTGWQPKFTSDEAVTQTVRDVVNSFNKGKQ
jgi:UDP-glucose 4-epimerase